MGIDMENRSTSNATARNDWHRQQLRNGGTHFELHGLVFVCFLSVDFIFLSVCESHDELFLPCYTSSDSICQAYYQHQLVNNYFVFLTW